MRNVLAYKLNFWLALLLVQMLALHLLTSQALAKPRIETTLDPASGTASETFLLSVTLTSSEQVNVGRSHIPEHPSFAISEPTVSRSFGTVISGFGRDMKTQANTTVELNYRIRPKQNVKPGRYRLGKGVLEVNSEQRPFTIPEISIVKEERQAESNGGRKSSVKFTQSLNKKSAYVGEQILYTAKMIFYDRISNLQPSHPKFPNFLWDPLGKPNERVGQIAGRVVRVIDSKAVLFPMKPGRLEVPEREFSGTVYVQVRRPRRPRGAFADPFFDPLMRSPFSAGLSVPEERKFKAEAAFLDVKPLPPRPDGGTSYVPVGDLSLQFSADRDELVVGESLTVTLVLQGDANLKPFEIEKPDASRFSYFKVYADKPVLNISNSADRMIYTKTFKMALVAQKPGKYELPSYEVLTFDPNEGEYRLLRSTRKTISVKPEKSGNSDRLVVAGKQNRPSLDQGKREVSLLAEDLMPQRVGAQTYTSAKKVSNLFRLSVLFLLPSLCIAYYIRLQQQLASSADPLKQKQLQAYRLSQEALQQLPNTPSEKLAALGHTLKSYLGNRFASPPEGLTTESAGDLVAKHLGKSSLAEGTKKAFGKLEKLQYSGIAGEDGAKDLSALTAEIRNLIDDIEKNTTK